MLAVVTEVRAADPAQSLFGRRGQPQFLNETGVVRRVEIRAGIVGGIGNAEGGREIGPKKREIALSLHVPRKDGSRGHQCREVEVVVHLQITDFEATYLRARVGGGSG